MAVSDALIDAAWTVYATPDDGCVVRPSIPILYFGDADRYARSPLKVATVALNPSHHEFPAADRFARFPLARAIDPRTLEKQPGSTTAARSTATSGSTRTVAGSVGSTRCCEAWTPATGRANLTRHCTQTCAPHWPRIRPGAGSVRDANRWNARASISGIV